MVVILYKKEKELQNSNSTLSLTQKLIINSKRNDVIYMITWDSKKCKLNMQLDINDNDPIKYAVKMYYHYCDCNNFNNLKCPCCRKCLLSFHKRYERNLVYYYNGKVNNITVNIAVCKCEECSKIKDRQKYHAILPDFVLPYIIYEASAIMKVLSDYYNKMKIQQIIDKYQICHKLLYDWIKKINIYSFSASVVLGINNIVTTVISNIIDQNSSFLNRFYYDYHHPFFLFKSTCVPLCFIP